MKKLFYFILSVVVISCTTRTNQPLTSEEKDVLISEIKPVLTQIIENSEKGNLDKALEPYLNSSEFVGISNGQVFDYNGMELGNKQYFESMNTQKFTEKLLKYSFINADNVIVTWGGSAIAELKDGQKLNVDPFAATLLFTKTEGNWKVIYSHESSVMGPIQNESDK
jgi:hypothetical protein